MCDIKRKRIEQDPDYDAEKRKQEISRRKPRALQTAHALCDLWW